MATLGQLIAPPQNAQNVRKILHDTVDSVRTEAIWTATAQMTLAVSISFFNTVAYAMQGFCDLAASTLSGRVEEGGAAFVDNAFAALTSLKMALLGPIFIVTMPFMASDVAEQINYPSPPISSSSDLINDLLSQMANLQTEAAAGSIASDLFGRQITTLQDQVRELENNLHREERAAQDARFELSALRDTHRGELQSLRDQLEAARPAADRNAVWQQRFDAINTQAATSMGVTRPFLSTLEGTYPMPGEG